jgi:hypothetical protein
VNYDIGVSPVQSLANRRTSTAVKCVVLLSIIHRHRYIPNFLEQKLRFSKQGTKTCRTSFFRGWGI